MDKEKFMARCIELAKNGLRTVVPNPMVGSVIVYNEKIIGEGYHIKNGGNHAEVNAINSVEDKHLLKHSTMYISLEPCSHFGKTPPCTDLILKHQIPRVVIACKDPFFAVSGNGIKKLQENGCKVTVGLLEKETEELNKRFFTFHTKKRPYIILKWAETVDGFIDVIRQSYKKESPTWITNELARSYVHKWRYEEQAIMVGTHTAQLDNPMLDVRAWTGGAPIRITLDRTLQLNPSLHLFNNKIPTIIFTEKTIKQKGKNIEFIKIDFNKEVMPQILDCLYTKNIQSILVEGGKITLESLLNTSLWDEARIFVGNTFFYKGIQAPNIKNGNLVLEENIEDCKLYLLKNIQ